MTQSVPTAQECGACMWFDIQGMSTFYGRPIVVDDPSPMGWCRRYPARPAGPVSTYPTERRGYVLGVEWPEVRASDWCGEWKQA